MTHNSLLEEIRDLQERVLPGGMTPGQDDKIDLGGVDLVDRGETVYDAATQSVAADAPVDSVNGQTGTVSLDHTDVGAAPSDVDSSTWNDYEIQKNGSDGDGIINFKT